MEQPQMLSIPLLKRLLAASPRAPAVTIYLPTHVSASPPHISEDQIRLKNLKNRACSIIKTREDAKEFADELNRKLEELLANTLFWEHQTRGLLICARPGRFYMFHLPLDTSEYLAVDERFRLAQILGLLSDYNKYYVLSLAQHSPKLYSGDFYGLSETDVGLPQSLLKGLNIDEMGRPSEQQVSAYGNARGFNGRGGDKNPAEEERQRFWRMIDQLVLKHADKKQPLILAGIDSEVSEYRALTHYPNVLNGHIEGSFSGSSGFELFQPALEIIENELVQPEHQAVVDQFKQAPGLTARDFAAITDAADKGRVDKLLLAGIRYTADTVRDNKQAVPVIEQPPEESAAAVHNTAYKVWNSGGTIINLETDEMPVKDSLMLATLRY